LRKSIKSSSDISSISDKLSIVKWEVNIRPCEFNNFAKIVYGTAPKLSRAEQHNLSQYLTKTGDNLSEIQIYLMMTL